MSLITKTILMKWNGKNKKWYENKGYIFSKVNDEFEVKVEDLQNSSHVKVEVYCDCCKKILKPIKWRNYKKYVNYDNSYYCQKCSSKLYGIEKRLKINFKNGKSFEQWCIDNNRQDILDRWDYDLNKCRPSEINYGTKYQYYFKCDNHLSHKSEPKTINSFTNGQQGSIICSQCNSFEQWCVDNNRQDALDRWDYELNNKKPIEISFSTAKKYYFKCPKEIHKSELKNINSFISGYDGSLKCNQCNSLAQYLIDTYGENALELYWDYEKNKINPFQISRGSKNKVYIKCQKKDYHGSYKIECKIFSSGTRCSYCGNFHVHPLDSLGKILEDKNLLHLWSDKNKKSSYKYAPCSGIKVWWKCSDGKHEDYCRSISGSNTCKFRCPYCQYSKGETRIEEYLKTNNIGYTPQKEYEGLLGLGGKNLSYDFYLPTYNLLIEYQGEQHEKYIKGFHKTKKEFEKQLEHDRRKKEYAETNNIELLEIWYWDYDNIEKILDKKLK